MLKALAIAAIAFVGTANFATAEVMPVHKHKQKKIETKSDAKSEEAKDDLPNGPTDVPRWMGKAVGDILTGEGPLSDDEPKPAKK